MANNFKTAIITGGARRIGAAICRRLHQNNINLLVHYNSSKDDAIKLEAELSAKRKNSITIISADLINRNECEKLIKTCNEIYEFLTFITIN